MGFLLVKNEFGELILDVLNDVFTLLDEMNDLGKDVTVSNDLSKLGEMPREPFLESHDEGVDVLVHCLDKSDGLNDGLILSVNVSLALLSGVLMGKTELGAGHVLVTELLEKLGDVGSDSSDQLLN